MLRDFLVWMAAELGKGEGDTAMSWTDALAGSLNFWNFLEGTHVMALMLFAGTIFMVDLRLLGLAFKRTPVSVISDRVLPLTVFGFVLLLLTGLGLFFAKPLLYYHSVWFRFKLIFLAIAFINIMIFHVRVQRDIAAWDDWPKPPTKAQISAIVSIVSWIVVITFGRFIAYDWLNCGKPQPHWVNVVAECKTSDTGALELTDALQ